MSTDELPFMTLDESQQRSLHIGILVAPGFAPIDIIGLHTVFGILPGNKVHLLWKNRDEIIGIPEFPTRATTTFDECPHTLDVLFAGAVLTDTFEDPETLEFLADQGSRAGWVGGACAGSLLMGAAGLLRGYKATTNFQQHHLLTHFGAIPAPGNVVEDRNRITAGPVTGSIEVALRLVQHYYGDDIAREMELQIEYAPTPLFGVGTPELAGEELTNAALRHAETMGTPFVEVAERAGHRLGITVNS